MSTRGMSDGVSKVWVMNREHGLDLSGFTSEVEAIDHLVRVALVKRVPKDQILVAVEKALAHLDDRGERGDWVAWGVWCVPTHPKTARWPEHWWGQFWSTKDKIALGTATEFDEPGAKAEAAKQTKQDPGGAYRYEARPLLSE